MADLTAEEISELRNALPIVVPSAAEVSVTMDAAHWMAVVRLLDEVERSREIRRVVGGCPPGHGTEHAAYCSGCCAKFNPERMLLLHQKDCIFRKHKRATD